MKKLISLVLSLLIIVSCVAVTVSANTNIYSIDDVAEIDNYVSGNWESGTLQYHNKRIATNGYVEVDASKTYKLIGTSQNHPNFQFYLNEFDTEKNCVGKIGKTLLGMGTYTYTPSSSRVVYIALTITIQGDAVLAEDTNGIFNRFRNKGYGVSMIVDADDVQEPTEPSEPIEPSEPTEPSEPIEPTEPTEPDEPSTPTTPTTPPAGDLTDKLTDTSDFSLSSIELTEQMLIGYNIGNCFEMTELRPNYVRPECSNMDELIYHKETMAGNVAVTEDYIKYLKSIGIQAIRLPVTWFNMLEDENGNIYPKNTWYSDLETRKQAWYNGKINEEFLARVKQVVDWIIENDMYCMINTHHDAAVNTANPVNPIVMDEAHKEQTYNYLTNIWSQVGEYFKDYGSKLMFEFYNETSSVSGHMTPSNTADDFTSDLLCHLIPLIRNQGSNNANRFLVCPRYGGVSLWNDNEYLHRFLNSDTADDKIIITTHTYTSCSNLASSIKSVRNRMNNIGIGAIIDEIGATDAGSNLKEKSINAFASIRKASDEHKVSVFFWDGGHQDCAITNRYYLKPSAPALGAYVGKDIEFENYTKEEVLSLTQSTQPNWVELYTEDGTDYAGKYLLLTSANKITTLYKSGLSTGYYSHTGAENGLFTYFTSDDGVNYNLMSTCVPTPWTKIAWSQLQVSGSSYYTKQIGGNYKIEKIGDGLQSYVATGNDLIPLGGDWQKGHYATNGKYEGEGTSYYNARISLVNKIPVLPNNYYQFHLVEKGTKYQFIIRAYNQDGGFVKNLGTITNGALQTPSNAYYISVSLYDSHQSEKADALFSYLEDGTLNPTMYLYVDAGELECRHTPIENSGVVTKPTCKAEGYTEYTCIKCGEKYKQDFVAITSEHTPVVDQAIEPTCTKSGLKEGSHCAICDKVLVAQQTVDALGHIEVIDKGYDATCTEKGLTDGSHCDVCKEVLIAQTTIEKKPHTRVEDKGYAPTCTTPGLTNGAHCDVCKTVLEAQQPIEVSDHIEKVTKKGVAPTCTLQGITDEICCSVCNVKLQNRTFIPAKGHKYTEKITKKATCGKTGVKTYSCECGYSYTKKIAATNSHKYKWTTTKKATYFAKGTSSYKCTTCGKVAKTKSIAKLVLKKPTVTYKTSAKKISIKYTKVSGATGFQVRYRLTSSKKWKTVTFKTSKSATKYIKNLKKNKKYYLQTRAYVQSGSKKAYSSWTTRKTIKVK